MPLSAFARRSLSHGLKSMGAGDQVADIIDAATGTVPADAARRIRFMAGNSATGNGIVTQINAAAALTGGQQAALAMILNSRGAAAEIATALAAE